MAIYRGSESTGTATQVFNIDGDKGDITVTNGGDTWTIDSGVVNTSKLGGDITAQGKALLDDATAAQQRTTLGLGSAATQDISVFATAAQGAKADTALQPSDIANVLETSDIGTTVQAYSANLDEYAAVNPTTAGLALLDDADAAAQRTTLGLGTAATTNSTAYATAAQGTKADTAVQPSDIANMLETSDIGVTVQGYDADTAKYDDVTANFTGTLQNGGSNVLVDSDIGSTVLAYDSNLQGFVNTFTLPTTDSTNGYVLTTNGSGTISWQPSGAGSMIYPGAGIAVSTGSAWGTSITDNSTNWNTAYSWGDHATAGYLDSADIGVSVQAYDAQLADIAALTPTDNTFIVGNGTNFVSEDAATARTSLGLGTIATQAANNVTITGGTVNGTTVGATSPSTGSFTSLSNSGNLTFTGTGNRIRGDFSNATIANRVVFQSSTTDGNTTVGIIPNGTAISSFITAYGSSDPTNTSFTQIGMFGTQSRITSGITGTGTYRDLTFYTGGSERMRIDTSGNVGINTNMPATYDAKLAVNGNISLTTIGQKFYPYYISATNHNYISSATGGEMTFGTGISSPAERMRIDSSGNVGIGTTFPGADKLRIEATTGNTQITLAANGVGPFQRFLDSGSSEWAIGIPDSSQAFAIISGRNETTSGIEYMRIHSSGGVSIGNTTDSGAASLNVSGSISGGYIARAAGTTAMGFAGDNVVRVTPNASATYTTTVPAAGAICVLSILTSGTTSYTITFGTGFKATGTLATGTVSARYFNITFVSDGTNLIEMARTVAIA